MSSTVRLVRVCLPASKTSDCRSIFTSASCLGKRNFRKFLLYEKRGSRMFKEKQRVSPDPEVPVDTRGVRSPEVTVAGRKQLVPEMIPELVVPDIQGFKLKPYVSYQAPDVAQTQFTAKDLYDAVYSRKVVQDFMAGKLDSQGCSLSPSEQEQLTPEQARIEARKTGSDLF